MKYERAVAEAERWEQMKRRRELDLRHFYVDQQGKDTVSAQALIDKDGEVVEFEILRQRAVARAAMYGPGAIMDLMRAMR
jgi:hypothetical protein